jgi:hypothetical protein
MSVKPSQPATKSPGTYYNSPFNAFSPEINVLLLEQELTNSWIGIGYVKKDLKEVSSKLDQLSKVKKPTPVQISQRDSLSKEKLTLELQLSKRKEKLATLLAIRKSHG